MKLVDKWWKAWSLRIAAAGIALPEAVQILGEYAGFLSLLPPEWRIWIYGVALVGILFASPVRQKNMGD